MKWLTQLSEFIAFGVGLIAAYYWWLSSQVEYGPKWGLPGTGGHIEPVDETSKQIDINTAILEGAKEAGKLNKIAALLTGISLFFSALSTLSGAAYQ
jgi:hypothetical protein